MPHIKIAKMNQKPLVYICSPYRDNIKLNTEIAQKACRYAVDNGYVPIAPHLLFPQFMSDESERKLAVELNKTILAKCDELWVFRVEDTISNGMVAELDYARLLKTKIEWFDVTIRE